jgi:hypothetical protein
LRLWRCAALLGFVGSIYGQYAGPAILARGEAPAAMAAAPAYDFRPFVEVSGIYDTGLAGVGVSNGGLANASSPGVGLVWGINGGKNWRHTKIGLSYRGSLDFYSRQSYYDTTNQYFLLGITHDFTRHIRLTLREAAGVFSRDFGQAGLAQTVPFDPSFTNIPRTDFFDNRTAYVSTQADLTIQKTARLSFDLGGDGSIISRRSAALYGVVGAGARGDMQYRVTRNTTIGAQYSYQHFDFTRVFGGTDVQSFNGTYGIRLSRRTELSAYGGVMRIESKFIQVVPVDPVIAALLGISSASQVFHAITTRPTGVARLSRTFPTGVAYVGGGYSVVPGNGLFLTSYVTSVLAGYGYTGLKHWSFSTETRYMDAEAEANISGKYKEWSGSLGMSRTLGRSFHFVVGYYVHRYSSPDFQVYNRAVHDVRIGIGYAPGDTPLRLW